MRINFVQRESHPDPDYSSRLCADGRGCNSLNTCPEYSTVNNGQSLLINNDVSDLSVAYIECRLKFLAD